MYLWRKKAKPQWVEAHETALQANAPDQLVIVRKPARKRLELEIACRSRSDSSALLKKFGGRVEMLPSDWLARFADGESTRIKIGKRLLVLRSVKEAERCSRLVPQRSPYSCARADALRAGSSTASIRNPALLVIPASLAFGTGEHATTAMSLRLLEQLTRRWNHDWSFVDVGTGSGILALAAKRFGATRVIGIDHDSAAVAAAKSNARLNQIREATFQLADVRRWKFPQETDVITANLYSDLLLEILPKLRANGWLILSGILRSQQDQLVRALRGNDFDIRTVKCCGKWIALMARPEPGQCDGETLRR